MAQGIPSVGISALEGRTDLADFGAHLDEVEALGVDTIEIPTYDQDLVVGGRIRRDQLATLKGLTKGRNVRYTVHGPLAVNFFDPAWRLPRHFDVLRSSIEVAAELGAVHYVMHAGFCPLTQRDGLEDCYARQREWLAKAGDVAREHDLYLCVENLFAGYLGDEITPTPSRLAAELASVNHPNVAATLDFSHSYINLSFAGGDLVSECAALAPFARHLHVHDSFGRQDDIWTYTEGEKIAYGHGDLHLPVGWGDIPWKALMAACAFPHGVVFNIELNRRHWHAAKECVAATRTLAAEARTAPRPG